MMIGPARLPARWPDGPPLVMTYPQPIVRASCSFASLTFRITASGRLRSSGFNAEFEGSALVRGDPAGPGGTGLPYPGPAWQAVKRAVGRPAVSLAGGTGRQPR